MTLLSRFTQLFGPFKHSRVESNELPLNCEEIGIRYGQQVDVTFKDPADAFALFNELVARSKIGNHAPVEGGPLPDDRRDARRCETAQDDLRRRVRGSGGQ